jgi:hypothetical protein
MTPTSEGLNVTPRSAFPIDDEVAGAVAKFFHGGMGPAHSAISRILISTGYDDEYAPPPRGVQGINKENRVLGAFRAARRQPAAARELLEGFLIQLRLDGLIGAGGDPSVDEQRLRMALGRSGWYLTDDGLLRAFAGVDLDTGGRAALGYAEPPPTRPC